MILKFSTNYALAKMQISSSFLCFQLYCLWANKKVGIHFQYNTSKSETYLFLTELQNELF